ncbi:hypothetical protein HELA111659_01745 [Helicobacter labetoulli]
MRIGHLACGDFLGHSVLSDKSAILRSPTTALTPSKLLVGSLGADEVKPVPRKNTNSLKKPAVASPCTALLVFSSQSLECQDSSGADSTPCHTELCGADSIPCHTEPLGEVSRTESKRDFSPFLKAQNDKILESQVDSYSHIALIHFNF